MFIFVGKSRWVIAATTVSLSLLLKNNAWIDRLLSYIANGYFLGWMVHSFLFFLVNSFQVVCKRSYCCSICKNSKLLFLFTNLCIIDISWFFNDYFWSKNLTHGHNTRRDQNFHHILFIWPQINKISGMSITITGLITFLLPRYPFCWLLSIVYAVKYFFSYWWTYHMLGPVRSLVGSQT